VQRIEKVLEEAGIKTVLVATDIMGGWAGRCGAP